MSKKCLSILFILILVFGCYSIEPVAFGAETTDNTNTVFAGGNGTENNPYLISNSYMFSGIIDFPDSYFLLTNDINLSSIGRMESFKGVFDGNGKTIIVGSSDKNGLFNTIESGGIVKNLVIDVGANSFSSFPESYGAVCNNNKGKIINCHVKGTISCYYYGQNAIYFGGIVAENYGFVEKCRCSINFNVDTWWSNGFYFGGICGINGGDIKNCLFDGSMNFDYAPNTRYHTCIGSISGYGYGQYSNCAVNSADMTVSCLSSGNYGYYFHFGVFSGIECYTADFGYRLPENINSLSSCIIRDDFKYNVSFQYYGSGGGLNYYTKEYDSSRIKNVDIKSSSEITEWWNNLIKDDEPPTPDISKYEFSLSGNNYYLLNKESTLSVGYCSATDGQVLSELKNIKWTNSNPDIATVSGFDTGVADTDNNRVSVMATVNALNVGTTTIEGTSPDGRKASFVINVEPEIKASSVKTLNKKTDLTVFSITLNTYNKEYLQEYVNRLDLNYKFNGSVSFNVEGPRTRFSNDGRSVDIIYSLQPTQGGSVIFSATSSLNQTVSSTINSKVNYSLNIEWGKDNFSFENKISDLPLIRLDNGDYNYNMDYSLFNHLDFLPSDIIAMKNNLQPCGGVCFGMSVVAFKNATNQLNTNSLQSGKSTLYQLSKPKDNGTENLRNAIGLYQSSCASSKYHNARDKFINLSTHDKLSILYNKLINIEDTRRPVVLDYAWISDEAKHNSNEETGVSAHAVLAYGIENEYAPYEVNGKRYEYKIWIINPNNSFNSNTDIATASQYCMYLDGDLDEFCIPVGGTRTDSENYYSLTSTANGEMNHLGDAILQFATDDYDLLPSTTSDISNNAVLTVSNQAAVINGNLISGYNGNDSSIVARSFTPCGQGASMNLTINKNNIPEVKTVSNNQTIGYASEKTAAYITANKNSIIKFDDESIDFKNTNGAYQIELAINDSKFNDIILSNIGNQSDVNVEFNTQGLLISGDNLDGMTIESNTDSIKLDTDKDSVAVNEINNKLVVLEDVAVGDVNLDGIVSISDATTVQKQIAGMINFNDLQTTVADTNGDGTINIFDVTTIQKYLAVLIDHFGQPANVSLSSTTLPMYVGDTKTLTATITPNDAPKKDITWTSSDKSIATVSNGIVTAISPGTITITAKTYNGKAARCTVTVKPIEPRSISLNKSTLTLYEGDTYQLSATVNPINANDKSITWYSNNNSVASVDSNGKVISKSIGSANITAKTSNGKKAECSITVKDKWEGYTKVYTSEDFNNIRNNLTGKFVLMNDIDLSSFGNWIPIGSRYNPFKGSLEGQNHSIKISGLTDDEYGNYGIFAETQGFGEIKNLTVNGSVGINSNNDVYCGIFIACCSGTKLINCTNNVSLSIDTEYSKSSSLSISVRAGGIIGSRSSYTDSQQISDCTNNGKITVKSKGGEHCSVEVGGIIGSANQGTGFNIVNCSNNGKIEAKALSYYYGVAAGGIVGTNFLDTINISNCSNNAMVSSVIENSLELSQCSAGGIIGSSWNNAAQIQNCESVEVEVKCEKGDAFSGKEIGYIGEFTKVFSY